MLDGDDVAPVQGRQKANTGVDRFIVQLALMQATDQNGAGTAIALGTAFLAARQALIKAQVIQQGQRRFDVSDALFLSVQKKADLMFLSH